MKNEDDHKQSMRIAIDIMIHSVHKPDSELRLEAKGGECYYELMQVRNMTIEFLNKLRETYKP